MVNGVIDCGKEVESQNNRVGDRIITGKKITHVSGEEQYNRLPKKDGRAHEE